MTLRAVSPSYVDTKSLEVLPEISPYFCFSGFARDPQPINKVLKDKVKVHSKGGVVNNSALLYFLDSSTLLKKLNRNSFIFKGPVTKK